MTQYIGFHNHHSFWIDNDRGARSINILNAVGYIPVLGIITGIFRIAIGVWVEEDASKRAIFIGRGITELVGCGILFLIPDLIASIGRACSGAYAMPQEAAHT